MMRQGYVIFKNPHPHTVSKKRLHSFRGSYTTCSSGPTVLSSATSLTTVLLTPLIRTCRTVRLLSLLGLDSCLRPLSPVPARRLLVLCGAERLRKLSCQRTQYQKLARVFTLPLRIRRIFDHSDGKSEQRGATPKLLTTTTLPP